MRLLALSSFCLVLGLVVLAVSPAPAQGQRQNQFELTKAEQQVIDLTNAERKKENLPPLKVSLILSKVARDYSAKMAKQQKLDHYLDGTKVGERVKAGGYKYSYIGENLAAGDVPVPQIVEGWMKSKLHRENILNDKYTEIGVGIALDNRGDAWYTQVFGLPKKPQ